jgi:hypothetical protein
MITTCEKICAPAGGFLFSSSIEFSGDDMAYLYPDGRTSLIGTFEQEKMVKVRDPFFFIFVLGLPMTVLSNG